MKDFCGRRAHSFLCPSPADRFLVLKAATLGAVSFETHATLLLFNLDHNTKFLDCNKFIW